MKKKRKKQKKRNGVSIKYDKNGKLNGFIKTFGGKEKLIGISQWKDGKRNGKTIEYDYYSKIQIITEYEKGEMIRKYKEPMDENFLKKKGAE